VKNLDRDGASVPDVVGEVDRSHPAPADLTLDEVSAGECFVQE